MLTFKKSLAGDLLARAYYLLSLRSHTDLVVGHFQSQNLLSLCLTTAIGLHIKISCLGRILILLEQIVEVNGFNDINDASHFNIWQKQTSRYI